MNNGFYITEKDIEVYNEVFAKQGFAPTLENKFKEILKIYSNIVYPGKSEYIHFMRLGDKNLECFDYNYKEYIDIPIDFLKNENWQEILQKQIDDKNKNIKLNAIKGPLLRYFEIKNKAIEIAKELALLKGVKLSDIERGTFTLITSLDSIREENIIVSYELRVFYGELDDHKILSFPMELLVIDDWKEKLKEFFDSRKELVPAFRGRTDFGE